MFIKEIRVNKIPSIKEYFNITNDLESEVRISKGDYHVIANSILGLTALGLCIGDKVVLSSIDKESINKVEGALHETK